MKTRSQKPIGGIGSKCALYLSTTSVCAFLFFSIFIFANNAFATSGACSWHGGVNCNAGAGWGGAVICNDGWQNSLVSFYDADECKTICYEPIEPSCSVSGLRALQGRYGGGLGLDSAWESTIQQCQQQIDNYERKLQDYNKCESSRLNSYLNLSPIQTPSNDVCDRQHGQYSKYSIVNNRCECYDGFAPDSNNPFQCINIDIYCKGFYGAYATSKNPKYIEGQENCMCSTGSELNSQKNQCVLIEAKWPKKSTPTPIPTPITPPISIIQQTPVPQPTPQLIAQIATQTPRPTIKPSPKPSEPPVLTSSITPTPEEIKISQSTPTPTPQVTDLKEKSKPAKISILASISNIFKGFFSAIFKLFK